MGRVLAVPLALLAIGAAACSGSDGAASSPASASGSTPASAGSVVLDLPAGSVADDDQGIGPPRSDELGPATMPRPCLMVSFDELEELTGAVAVRSEEGVLRRVTTCFVLDASGEKLMSLALGPPEAFDEAAAAPSAVRVDGVGDDAVLVDGVLHVRHEQEDMAVKLYPATAIDEASTPTVLEALASGAIDRYIPPPPTDTSP